jgi:hypothetical protein
VAPKKAPLSESNSNSLEDGSDGSENGISIKPAAIKKPTVAASRPRWGGAEICPRCNKSVSKVDFNSLNASHFILHFNVVCSTSKKEL